MDSSLSKSIHLFNTNTGERNENWERCRDGPGELLVHTTLELVDPNMVYELLVGSVAPHTLTGPIVLKAPNAWDIVPRVAAVLSQVISRGGLGWGRGNVV